MKPHAMTLPEAHRVCALRLREALRGDLSNTARAQLEQSLTIHEREARRK